MAISAALVKELRDLTGAGMMDCKKALSEANGDKEKAIEIMRKSGQAKAVKKAGRTAAEGLVIIETNSDNTFAVMLEVNCETDFVARDDNFIEFANQCAKLALEHRLDNVAALSAQDFSGSGETVEQKRQALVAKIGENINLRRLVAKQSQGFIASYIHGNRIGVLVELDSNQPELGKDLAMHIAANSPIVVEPDQVPHEQIEKEREIFMAQAEASGKPADIVEKMVTGRIKKYVDEISLLGQPFVKQPDLKVAQLLKDKGAKVLGFERYAVGEGIEKEETNFADEVMSQVRGS